MYLHTYELRPYKHESATSSAMRLLMQAVQKMNGCYRLYRALLQRLSTGLLSDLITAVLFAAPLGVTGHILCGLHSSCDSYRSTVGKLSSFDLDCFSRYTQMHVSLDDQRILHGVSIKRTHFVFAHNFDVCQPVFIILGRHTMWEICKKFTYN